MLMVHQPRDRAELERLAEGCLRIAAEVSDADLKRTYASLAAGWQELARLRGHMEEEQRKTRSMTAGS